MLIAFVCVLNLEVWAQTNFRTFGYAEALSVAKEENKKIFIDFYTDWCAPCKRMAKEVFPQEKVGDYLNALYVCLQLNAEREGKELARKFHIEAYPTFVVIDTLEQSVFRIVGAMDADRFIIEMEKNSNPEYSPTRVRKRYLGGERTPRLVEYYVSDLMRDGKYAEGAKTIEDYFASLSQEQRMLKENMFIYLRYTLDWSSPRAQFFLKHRKDFDSSLEDKMNRHIVFLYKNEGKRYSLGSLPENNVFDKKQYRQWKRYVVLLPEEEREAFEPVFRLIECRANGNLKKYIKVCVSEFDKLDSRNQAILTDHVDKLIEHENHVSLKRAAKYVRKHLNKLQQETAVFSDKFLEEVDRVLGEKK